MKNKRGISLISTIIIIAIVIIGIILIVSNNSSSKKQLRLNGVICHLPNIMN